MPIDPQLIIGGIKLIAGLFGRKKKAPPPPPPPTPAQNIVSQAEGAREAAAKTGFNPLTVLQNGQPAGAYGFGASAGPAPLASTDLILGGLEDIGDVLSGAKAQRAAANKLQTDLAQIKLDQLRGGVLAVAPSAAASVGAGLPALGRRSAEIIAPLHSSGVALRFDLSPVQDVRRQSLNEQFVSSQGETITLPRGPDADEVLTGVGGEVAGYVKSRSRLLGFPLDNINPTSSADNFFRSMVFGLSPSLYRQQRAIIALNGKSPVSRAFKFNQKSGASDVPEPQVFSENFNHHMGRQRPYAAWDTPSLGRSMVSSDYWSKSVRDAGWPKFQLKY